MTHSSDFYEFLEVLEESVGSARLAQSIDTTADFLCAFRDFLEDHQTLYEPRVFAGQLREYIENALGAPCIPGRPGELSVHPANFGVAHIEPLRIAVLRAGRQLRLLLIAEHSDSLSGSYAMLCHAGNQLQPVLGGEEPGSLIYITDNPCRLRLSMDMLVSRPEDVSRLILRACFLLHKYHNALLEELYLTPGEEPEDEIEEETEEEMEEDADDGFDIPPVPPRPRPFRPFIRPDEPFPNDSAREGEHDDETLF